MSKIIFISYRRDDVAGYASKLEHDLERYFGENNVFRDVEDIPGGEKWKQVLDDNLKSSVVLIVIIGSRWEQIWNERTDKSRDYIVYELQQANERGIKIIPVTINGTTLSENIDLGPVSWLSENQQFDLMDKQGRWTHDAQRLVKELEGIPGLERVDDKDSVDDNSKKNNKKWWLIALGFFVVAGLIEEFSPTPAVQQNQSPTNPVVEDNQEKELPPETILVENNQQENLGKAAAKVGQKSVAIGSVEKRPAVKPKPTMPVKTTYPDISGLWQAEDGTTYEVSKVVNGRFILGNSEYQGQGEFIPKMPRKFKVNIPALGHGEYSVTADNQRVQGWFIYNGTYEKEYETLWRIK